MAFNHNGFELEDVGVEKLFHFHCFSFSIIKYKKSWAEGKIFFTKYVNNGTGTGSIRFATVANPWNSLSKELKLKSAQSTNKCIQKSSKQWCKIYRSKSKTKYSRSKHIYILLRIR